MSDIDVTQGLAPDPASDPVIGQPTTATQASTSFEVPGSPASSIADEGCTAKDSEWLCSSCEGLELSADKFIITPLKTSGSLRSFSGKSAKTEEEGPLRIGPGDARRAFTTFKQVQQSLHSCRLCRLICDAIQRYSKTTLLEETTLSLTWEVDGRQITERFHHVNRTRRIRISWPKATGMMEDIYLVLVALKASADAGLPPEKHFLGRESAAAAEVVDLMKGWVSVCEKNHGVTCLPSDDISKDFVNLAEGTYFGVIDVEEMRLRRLPEGLQTLGRYVALSYVWGGDGNASTLPYTTKRCNVMKRIQEYGLEDSWDELPRTIQDVLLLVRALGERYVWIDSLCIVQDSGISWALNAKAMHLVYGNAYFTICAADGDSSSGLRSVASVLRKNKSPWSRNNPRAPEDSGSNQGNYETLSAECIQGIRLLVSRPVEAVIQDSEWSRRGWTFQERLLSPRCLIFAEGQVYFQCRSAVMSQNTFAYDGGTLGWSLDWTNSPLRTLGELRRRAFWFYMKCVRMYTCRHLSKPKDILTAFQGTSWLLTQQLKAPMLFGLPTSHFDLSLLWVPLESLARRQPEPESSTTTVACHQDEAGSCSCKKGEVVYGSQEFPTWSWCGWMGGCVAYESDMIEGCLLNVQEWLRDHTWIHWFVRDHEGNLRPLWDGNVLHGDISSEARWRGYAGKNAPPDTPAARRPFGPSMAVPQAYPPTGVTSNDPLTTAGGSDFPPNPFARLPERFSRISERAGATVPGKSKSDSRRWSRKSNSEYLKRLPPRYYDPDDSQGDDAASRYMPSTIPNDAHPVKPDIFWRGRHRSKSNGVTVPGPPLRSALKVASADRTGPNKGAVYRSVGASNTAQVNGINKTGRASLSWADNPGPLRRAETFDARRMPAEREATYGMDDKYETYSLEEQEDIVDEESTSTWPEEDEDFPAHHAERNVPQRGSRMTWDSSDSEGGGTGARPGQGSPDTYGRMNRNTEKTKKSFSGILPENPFGVNRGPFPIDDMNWQRAQPVLQFWTWRTELHVRIRQPVGAKRSDELLSPGASIDKEEANGVAKTSSPKGAWIAQDGGSTSSTSDDCNKSDAKSSTQRATLTRCEIVDKAGDWCGSIVVPLDEIAGRDGWPQQFIAISDAKSLTKEECPVWNYYIPKEQDDSEWDLYYVLLLRRNRERALWERVALGKVFRAAFGQSAVWDEIKLG